MHTHNTTPFYQINFQKQFGGGEVYTQFLCQALDNVGMNHTLFVHPNANFWHDMVFGNTRIQAITPDIQPILDNMTANATVLTHGSIPKDWRMRITASGHRLVGIAHMPLYGRDQQAFDGYDCVIGVSQYVVNSLHDAGLKSVYPQPWYGVTNLHRMTDTSQTITRKSLYDWDLRKGRDRLLSWIEPLYTPFLPKTVWQKKAGLTLGIVSRITPIKQFPLLFNTIAPTLHKIPNLNIEIFGSGGYASVHDLKQALLPIKNQVRFWGHQNNVASIYNKLDFLLTGLPEKEALGLNVLEAQACNLPVLAVDALPFQETVLDGKTGYLFNDPRRDQGQHLHDILNDIINGDKERLQPSTHQQHLQQFTLDAFTQRIAEALPFLLGKM